MRRHVPEIILAIAVLLCGTGISATAYGYRLPPYAMTTEEKTRPAEENLERCAHTLEQAAGGRPLSIVENRRRDYKTRLSPKVRTSTEDFENATVAHAFWNYVANLKSELLSLLEGKASEEAAREADVMAKLIVQRIYDLSQEYEVSFSALINNALINSGHKKKGFCYHYVNDIKKALDGKRWDHFDLHWGEAWPNNFRENNALVVTAHGKAFHSGIAIDVWRTAGKPFWTPVEGDRFPWQEAFNVEEKYDLE
jgi:hypothetical protein